MTHFLSRFFAACILGGCVLLGGCASDAPTTALYDLGPLHAGADGNAKLALPAVSVADVRAPAWLDSQLMFYRLAYANDQQPRPYANSKWTMPPAQLFAQRLKSRLSQAGGIVVSAADGALNLPVLRIEADDFSQSFDSARHSSVHIVLRASLFDGRSLRAQKGFIQDIPAASADAPGGAAALAAASDAIINEMAVWLATLPPKN